MQQKNPNPNMIKIPKIVPPTSSYGMGGSDAETVLIKINIENRINKIITLFFLKIITNYTLLKIIYMIYYFCFKKVKKENNFIILQNLKFILSPECSASSRRRPSSSHGRHRQCTSPCPSSCSRSLPEAHLSSAAGISSPRL